MTPCKQELSLHLRRLFSIRKLFISPNVVISDQDYFFLHLH